MADSDVNRGRNTQNTRVQKNDAVSKQIAAQNQPDRSNISETVARLNRKKT